MTFNFAFYLSLVLAAMGCAGLLLAGRGKWYGWAIGLAVQPVWATYAIVTKGYGLLITCLMYGTVNGRNLWKWYTKKSVSEQAMLEKALKDAVAGKPVFLPNNYSMVMPREDLENYPSAMPFLKEARMEEMRKENLEAFKKEAEIPLTKSKQGVPRKKRF